MRKPRPAAKTIAVLGVWGGFIPPLARDGARAVAQTSDELRQWSFGGAERLRQIGLMPHFNRRQQRVGEALGEDALDARKMGEILRLAVAPIEPGEYAEDFSRPLRAHRGVGGGEGGDVESRVPGEATPRILRHQPELQLLA